jgi:hypothetical protein
MNSHPEINHIALQDRIRAIAYALWEEEGRPDGCAEQHWFRAVELVAAEVEPAATAPDPDPLQVEYDKVTEPPVPMPVKLAQEKSTKRNEEKKAA